MGGLESHLRVLLLGREEGDRCKESGRRQGSGWGYDPLEFTGAGMGI